MYCIQEEGETVCDTVDTEECFTKYEEECETVYKERCSTEYELVCTTGKLTKCCNITLKLFTMLFQV